MELWEKQAFSPVPVVKIDPSAVRNMNRLFSIYPGKLVISSSWKRKMRLDALRRIFKSNGLHRLPDSVTPNGENKGQEILRWLKDNRKKWPAVYLVIDDQHHEISGKIPARNFLQIENGWAHGFEEKHFREACLRINRMREFTPPENAPGYQSNERVHNGPQWRSQILNPDLPNPESPEFPGRQPAHTRPGSIHRSQLHL